MKEIYDGGYFSKNIKYLRKINKLSLEQFGKIFGKSLSTISAWELGKRSPITADLIEIANHFNIQVADLISQDISTDYSPIQKRDIVTEREALLLAAFRKLSPDQQKNVIAVVEGMAK